MKALCAVALVMAATAFVARNFPDIAYSASWFGGWCASALWNNLK